MNTDAGYVLNSVRLEHGGLNGDLKPRLAVGQQDLDTLGLSASSGLGFRSGLAPAALRAAGGLCSDGSRLRLERDGLESAAATLSAHSTNR